LKDLVEWRYRIAQIAARRCHTQGSEEYRLRYPTVKARSGLVAKAAHMRDPTMDWYSDWSTGFSVVRRNSRRPATIGVLTVAAEVCP
jgi:hypothetical protein